MNPRLSWAVAGVCMMVTCAAQTQTIRISCPRFFQDSHQRYSCVEALLSQDNYHFTLASLPPANGFAPGLVLTHTFDPILGKPAQTHQVDLSVTGAVSTNGSSFESGDIVWTLPYGSHDTSTSPLDLQSASEKNWNAMSFHLQAAHQAVHTIYFYGDGSRSPDQQFDYAEDDVWGKAIARVPVSRRVVLTAEAGLRATTLPPGSDAEAVNINIATAALAGYTEQPVFAVSRIGAESSFTHEFGRPLPDVADARSLLRYFLKWQGDNSGSFAWFHDMDSSPLSFRQFRFDGVERGLLYGRVATRSYDPKKHPLLYFTLCQGESRKHTELCNVLLLNVGTRLILSDVPSGNDMPFYLKPTLGGSDFDNHVTLRGWDHYRFRARNSALTQVDLNALVRDPFGIDFFYDAGTVGNSTGDLAMTRWRQDAGVGLTVRLQGSIVAQTDWAWGAGHGPHWSYNFAKVF